MKTNSTISPSPPAGGRHPRLAARSDLVQNRSDRMSDPVTVMNEPEDILATSDLLARVRRGDDAARDDLFLRFRVPLERFLHGRLPSAARGVMDTQDVTQEVCVKVFRSLDRFEHRGIGSFWAYLRQAAMNTIRDLPKTPGKLSQAAALPEASRYHPAQRGPSPDRALLQQEDLLAFERALETLPERQRHAVLMRLELDLDYKWIASECGFPSPDAARMAVSRGLELVAKEMSDGREEE